MLKRIENAVIHRYGYEHPITRLVFRLTWLTYSKSEKKNILQELQKSLDKSPKV